MATNNSRSMTGDFLQGTTDSSYMSLTPDRGGVLGDVPSDRVTWPNMQQVEQHHAPLFVTQQGVHAGKSIERQ